MNIPFCKREDQASILPALDDAGCVVENFFSAEVMDKVLDKISVLREQAKPDQVHVNAAYGLN